jgi:hypothetical protein
MSGFEMFCERCGKRYGSEEASAQAPQPLARRLLMAVGVASSPPRPVGTDPLLRFCLACRGYTCPDCWNDEAGFCQTCVPLPEEAASEHVHLPTVSVPAFGDLPVVQPMAATPPVVDVSGDEPIAQPLAAQAPVTEPTLAAAATADDVPFDSDEPVSLLERLEPWTPTVPPIVVSEPFVGQPRLFDPALVDSVVAMETTDHDEAAATAEFAAGSDEPESVPLFDQSPESDFEPWVPEPAEANADAEAYEAGTFETAGEPEFATQWTAEVALDEPWVPDPVEGEVEPTYAGAAPEAAPGPLYVEHEPDAGVAEPEPVFAAAPEPEPVFAEPEPEVFVAEPEPESVAVAAFDPDTEPEPETEPEPAFATESQPQPVFAEPEPELVFSEPEPEPTPAFARPEPEPDAGAAFAEPEPESVAVAAFDAVTEPEPDVSWDLSWEKEPVDDAAPAPEVSSVEPAEPAELVEPAPTVFVDELVAEPTAAEPMAPEPMPAELVETVGPETVTAPPPPVEPVPSLETTPTTPIAPEPTWPQAPSTPAPTYRPLPPLGPIVPPPPPASSVTPRIEFDIPQTPPAYLINQQQHARPQALAPRPQLPPGLFDGPGPIIRPCPTCDLPVSAKARFCRRCGSAQPPAPA